MESKINKNIFERLERSTGVILKEPPKEEKIMEGGNIMNKQGIGSEVIKEVINLVDAVKNGRLDIRADLRGTEGDERELLEVINEMIDAFVGMSPPSMWIASAREISLRRSQMLTRVISTR